jgi:hypothetical protein
MRRKLAKVEQTGPDQVTTTATDGFQSRMAAHVWNARLITIKHGLEWEIRYGGKLTSKAPSCFTIIREEFGIRGRDKVARYKEFCRMFGLETRKEILGAK